MQLWFDGCRFIQPIRGAGNEKYCLGGGYNVIICMSQGGGAGGCKQNLSFLGMLASKISLLWGCFAGRSVYPRNFTGEVCLEVEQQRSNY